jgi:hypothetical protein
VVSFTVRNVEVSKISKDKNSIKAVRPLLHKALSNEKTEIE